MGREVKRVPLDFDYPLHKVWYGYQIGFCHEDYTGAPVSPIFKTAEELADWCEDNATVFADIKASKEDWLKMIQGGMIAAEVGGVLYV